MKTSEVFKKTFGSLSDTVKEVRQQNLITKKNEYTSGPSEKVMVSKPIIFFHHTIPAV